MPQVISEGSCPKPSEILRCYGYFLKNRNSLKVTGYPPPGSGCTSWPPTP